MKRLSLAIGLLVAGSLMAFAQQPPSPPGGQPGTGRIRGHVVAADTKLPVRGARVMAFIADGQPPRETLTDAEGRYEITQLPAGSFRVSAVLDNIGVAYGARAERPMDDGEPVIVAPGQTVERIDISLPRPGVIVVKLIDEAGEPVEGAQVEIQRYQYTPSGERRLSTAPTGVRGPLARTDDRGELRVFGLRPGDYTVRATVRRGNLATTTDNGEGFSPTYYPGTTRVAEAQFVTIGFGDERNVVVRMVSSRLHRITGRIVTSDGQPPTGMDLQLAPGEGETGITYGAGRAQADGAFAIGGVPDGNYTLLVRQNERPSIEDLRAGRMPASLSFGVRGESVSLPLTVKGGDLTDLRVVTSRGATITGRVVMDSGAALPSTPEQQVIALPPGLAGGGWAAAGSSVYDFPPSAAIAAEGNFQLAGVRGRVQLDASVAESIVKSITLDGRDITDEILDVTGKTAVSGVVITMTDKIPTITGQVRGRDGKPLRKYSVVLLPRDSLEPAAVAGRIRTARASSSSGYAVSRARWLSAKARR